MNRLPRILLLTLIPLLPGCGSDKDEHAGHDHGPAHKHEHRAPHGGTAVVLGNEAFHLEFVRDAATGTLTCYVLDAHMENFVRIAAWPGVSGRTETTSTAVKPPPADSAATGSA